MHTPALSEAVVAPTQPLAARSAAPRPRKPDRPPAARTSPPHCTHSLHSHTSTPPCTLQATTMAALSLPPLSPPPLPQPPVVTSVCTSILATLLAQHPNRDFALYLLEGFHFGFSTGYHGPRHGRHAPNLQSALARPQVIHDYLATEYAVGHTAGPFPSPPLPDFVVSPLGAVPKKRSGKWHLIMHLSNPPGGSVNDGINITEFPLCNFTVYDTMDLVMRLECHAYMAKLDVKSAFRLCPVHLSEHHLLSMHWQGRCHFDRVVQFGLRSAPFIFNCLASAVAWLA